MVTKRKSRMGKPLGWCCLHYGKEAEFDIDFNSDGGVGSFSDLETAGSVALRRDSAGNLYAGNEAIYAGASQLRVDSLAAYTPLAVEDFGDQGGKQLLLMHSSGSILTWSLSATWSRSGSLGWTDPSGFAALEASFGIEL